MCLSHGTQDEQPVAPTCTAAPTDCVKVTIHVCNESCASFKCILTLACKSMSWTTLPKSTADEQRTLWPGLEVLSSCGVELEGNVRLSLLVNKRLLDCDLFYRNIGAPNKLECSKKWPTCTAILRDGAIHELQY